MKYTPGSWEAEPSCNLSTGRVTWQVWHKNGIAHVADVSRGLTPDPSGEANARLIAAAPDLLEALNDLIDIQNGPPLITYTDAWNAAMTKARAAIAKAEGKGGGE